MDTEFVPPPPPPPPLPAAVVANPPNDLEIRYATYSDLPKIAEVLTAAFWDDALFGEIIHPRRADFPKDNEYYWLWRARVNWWDWGLRYIVSVIREADGQEVLTGVALWARIGNGTSTGMKLSYADPRRLAKPLVQLYVNAESKLWPNRAASTDNEDIIERSYHYLDHMWTGGRAESWYLESLGVHPRFQGRGHGRALVRWGFEQAEKENICVSVISGDGKEEFYQKCGFEVQDGWSGMGEGNPLAIAPGGLMFWKDVDKCDMKSVF